MAGAAHHRSAAALVTHLIAPAVYLAGVLALARLVAARIGGGW